MELLTGAGLAGAAGLNAWLPLLLVGLAARLTDLVVLPPGWEWLGGTPVLVALAVLLLVEAVADKVPGVDHVNDVLQTVVRPLAGGVAASAGTGGGDGAGTAVGDAAAAGSSGSWASSVDWPTLVAGAALALGVHLLKTAGRAVVNAATLGAGAPVASTAEDALSLGLVAAALLAPLLVLVALAALAVVAVVVVRRRRRRGPGRLRPV
ncbi:DUF4126 domain-containing protein [Pseudokineococcus basanitobsidens]|uniref:DUF4126 domain-containing protein n=1 Tax=Pseudokineococcus basanitobsidens TaxID=1926649 RepID=A0ABU8RMX2_9ACTN